MPAASIALACVLFFFSSRRRHTRCSRDWSSDVCSSDLLSNPPRYARPSVTDPPICDVSSMTFTASFPTLGCHGLFFGVPDLENPDQLGQLQNFPDRGAQAKQDEARAQVARRFERFDQGGHAGAVNVANRRQV